MNQAKQSVGIACVALRSAAFSGRYAPTNFIRTRVKIGMASLWAPIGRYRCRNIPAVVVALCKPEAWECTSHSPEASEGWAKRQ